MASIVFNNEINSRVWYKYSGGLAIAIHACMHYRLSWWM